MLQYGYIYESTDKRNQILYIGKRKGDFDPEYHGSSLCVNNILNKYGNDIFTTKLIDYAKDKDQLNKMVIAYTKAYRLVHGNAGLYNISKCGESI